MPINTMKYSLSIIGALILMVSLLIWRTDGFRSYTYESNRRSNVENSPVQVSNWQLENTKKEMITLSSFQESLLFVDFIYTQCPTICRALGSRYTQLQALIDANPSSNIRLLSISIDPEFDTPENLSFYRQAHKGKEHSWELARPIGEGTLKKILSETGVRVIPDELWGYAHSDSVHIIQNGVLTRIEDWDSAELDALIRSNSSS